MHRSRRFCLLHGPLALLLLSCIPALAQASPAEKVYMLQVSDREWEIELRGGAQDWPGSPDSRAQQYVTDALPAGVRVFLRVANPRPLLPGPLTGWSAGHIRNTP